MIYIKRVALIFLLFLFSCKTDVKEIIKENKKIDKQSNSIVDTAIILNRKTVFRKEKDTLMSFQGNNEFEFKDFFDGNLKIKIPKGFGLMNEGYIKLKYPSINSNTAKVYSNNDGTVSLLLELSNRKLNQKSLEGMKKEVSDTFEKYPSIIIQELDLIKINNKKFVIVKFTSQAIDSRIYNLMFITDIQGKTFTGTFNCTLSHLSEWKIKSEEILSSIIVK